MKRIIKYENPFEFLMGDQSDSEEEESVDKNEIIYEENYSPLKSLKSIQAFGSYEHDEDICCSDEDFDEDLTA